MSNLLELELSLSRRDQYSYTVELRFYDPKSPILQAPARGTIHFQETPLRDYHLDPVAYGKQLFNNLFAPANVQSLYDHVRTVAQRESRPLRLRLFIHRDALDLHDLRWETLYDERPGGGWLLTNERLLFSRFLSSPRWEPAPPRAESDELRALVVIANPSDLGNGSIYAGSMLGSGERRPLEPIDVNLEKRRAQEGLRELYKEEYVLASSPRSPEQVTLSRLLEYLETGFDIVYIACHGALITRGEKPGPQLLLQKPDGTHDLVAGSDLIEQVENLAPERRPRLMVLASCQSAGSGGEAVTADALGALAALGPQLAQAGVPAVVAMQGSVSMDTVAEFMPRFFQELRTDGQIDRAVARARSIVPQRPDSWMPVLYLRLRDGNLWYTPRFSDANPEFIWERLLTGIKDQGQYTPILGPSLSEHLSGVLRYAAQRWAEEKSYPLAERSLDDLAQVAQYLANRDGMAAPRMSLLEHFQKQIESNFPHALSADLIGDTLEETLEKQIAKVASLPQFQDDAYSVLARLPFPIYITTNPDNLLTQALVDAHKPPVVDFARWNNRLRDTEEYPSAYEEARRNNYIPKVERPLVYHLFGRLKEPDSLILSEDDYFDYLMWVNQVGPQLPLPVGRALSNNGLLFLGFGIQDWSFRLLFRSILTEQRRMHERRYHSMAVQVRPGEGIRNPELARTYLEQYFAGVKIGVYWGSINDFIKELRERAQRRNLL